MHSTEHRKKNTHWLKGAIKHKGALHKSLGVPEGDKIPLGKIKKATKSSDPKLKRRAQLALTMRGFDH